MFSLSHVFFLRAYCALHSYHSHMSSPCHSPSDVKLLLLLLSPECTIEGRSHPSSRLLNKNKSHSSFCLFSFFFPHARKTFTEHQPSPPSSRRRTSYFDRGPQRQRQATGPSHRRQSTYTHTPTDRLYNRAIEHCVPPPFGRRYASPASLEGSIWQQVVNLRLANKGCQLQYLPQLQQIRETWTETYGLTFGPELPPPPPPPTPAQRERERVALLDRDLPVDLAAWTTLDDLPTAELRDAVAHIQSLLDRESVARCVQALWRYNGDPRGAIDWLVRSSQ